MICHRRITGYWLALTATWLSVGCTRVSRPAGPTSMPADTSCATASVSASVGAPSMAAETRCEPWDIGTGVTGYAWRAPNARAVLLLQHGYGHYTLQYARENAALISHLVGLGVNVYGFDMWGNGRSLGKRGDTDIDRALADHLAARRKLVEQPDTRALPLFLFGHSVGGLITVASVLRDETNVRGVILASPTLADANGVVHALTRLGASIAPANDVPGAVSKIESLTAVPELQQQLGADSLYFRRVTWITAASGASLAHANWSRYPNVRVPILVVHGDADQTANLGASRQFVDIIASVDKTLRVVPGGLHLLLDDTKREEVRGAILDWIQARTVPARTAAR